MAAATSPVYTYPRADSPSFAGTCPLLLAHAAATPDPPTRSRSAEFTLLLCGWPSAPLSVAISPREGYVILRDGATSDAAPLASAWTDDHGHFQVTLASGPDGIREVTLHAPAARQRGSNHTTRGSNHTTRRGPWWFEMPLGESRWVGDGGWVERFEWRKRRTEEGRSAEWELVVDNEWDNVWPGEVVAVWLGARLRRDAVGWLEFQGRGATGEFGGRWRNMATVTCMCVSQLRS